MRRWLPAWGDADALTETVAGECNTATVPASPPVVSTIRCGALQAADAGLAERHQADDRAEHANQNPGRDPIPLLWHPCHAFLARFHGV